MKKISVFVILLFAITYCQGQDLDSGRGLSFSYSTNNTWAIDIFYRSCNNRFHLGYGHQFNGQKIKVFKKQKETSGLTETENGEYFWVIDLGYSRIFIDRITVHSELSIGGKNQFTNFQDYGYNDDGFSIITDSKLTTGIGLNIGYLIRNGLEPFIGIHTLKSVTIGIRLSN